MKNTLKRLMAFVVLISAVAVGVYASPSIATYEDAVAESEKGYAADILSENAACGDNLSWSIDEDGILNISGSGAMYNWDSVENTPWYSSIDEITSVVVAEGVTSIGSNAFDMVLSGDIDADFGDLVYEAVAEGQIGSIGWTVGDNDALYLSGTGKLCDFSSEQAVPWREYKESITRVFVADTVMGIGDCAFCGMTSLERVTLPESVISLGENVFAGCTALTELFLGGVDSVTADVFADCSSLEIVNAGNYECYLGIKDSLGDTDLEIRVGENKRVIALELPSTLTNVGYGAFDRFFCVVTGYKNSYAEEFAQECGFEFVSHYISIELGEKLSESNVRYVGEGGFRYEFDGDTYYVRPDRDMLIEVVEKENADSIYAVRTSYYYVDSENADYTEITGLASFVGNKKDASIRIKDPVSIRYTSGILTAAKMEKTDFVVKEYGFIVGMKSLLEEKETQLNFDFERYATGVAYSKEKGIDLVFDSSDDDVCIFTGVLVNVPRKHYTTVFASKTYVKLEIAGEEFVVYGEQVNTSMYDTAKKLAASEELSSEQRAAVLEIIHRVEDDENGIPADDLFS